MSVPITITNAGLAKLVNASNSGTAAIAITAIGVTASIVAADPTLTALPGEIKRISTISGQVVAANVIHIGMQDNSADPYTMNSFGLYLADGTLFAVYGQTTPIYIKTAASIGLLACDITFSQGSAAAVTFGATGFLNPPASATVPGVVQLATQAQASAGTDIADVLTPATAKAALLSWLGYTPVQAGGGTGDQPGHAILIGWSGTALRVQVDATDFGPLVFASQIAMPNSPGIVQLASTAQAIAGIDGADALTPVTALAAFKAWLPGPPAYATPSTSGLVQLANQAQANGGTDASDVLTPATAAAAVLDWIPPGTFILGTDGTMSGSNANGYWEKRANGILEQWGTVTLPSGSNVDTGTLTLPLAFTDLNYVITGNVHLAANTYSNWHPAVFMIAPTSTTAAAWIADTVNNSYAFASGNSFSWRAIGHYK